MELSEVQLFVIATLATIIVYLLKLVAQYFKWTPGRGWLSVFLYLVAGALAFAWGQFVLPAFPPFSDPVSFVSASLVWLSNLLVLLGPVVALATLIYNVLAKQVFDNAMRRFRPTAKSKKK